MHFLFNEISDDFGEKYGEGMFHGSNGTFNAMKTLIVFRSRFCKIDDLMCNDCGAYHDDYFIGPLLERCTLVLFKLHVLGELLGGE